MRFYGKYEQNVKLIRELLHVERSFDIIERKLTVGKGELTMYYLDGFVKDAIMQKLFMHLVSLDKVSDAATFITDSLPHIEVGEITDASAAVTAVLSGQTLVLGSGFGDRAILIDARTYPGRDTAEPDTDRVMHGSHDGFVETMVINVALIRRRLRTPNLTMSYVSLGESCGDAVVCYIEGRADKKYVEHVKRLLHERAPKTLTLGYRSLAESLIRRRWFNPFPKIRTTERPDVASSELVEGSVIVLCDTSPQAMILPTSIFDFLQETDDFYFPPMTGCYLRVVRHAVFWLSLFLTPVWYLLVSSPDAIPDWLSFVRLDDAGDIPILLQLLLVEFAVDGLQLASMNTPSMLTNSLSVIGGLILGDFAVTVGVLTPDVILYSAIVTIAAFTQPSNELGYAFKFMRMMLLVLIALLGGWGLALGTVLILVILITNSTVNGPFSYFYPVCPFDARALARLFLRLPKREEEKARH